MLFFEKYRSNSLAGSGNQSFFTNGDPDALHTSRVFYRLFAGGTFDYSLLFSNLIDSTFSDGSHSHANLVCGGWTLERAAAAVCGDCSPDLPAGVFRTLTFGGSVRKEAAPGEFFCSDPFPLTAEGGGLLCVELTFRGRMLPCHEELNIPAFVLENGGWVPSSRTPVPGMIGCARPVRAQVAFLGDSITQGLGTACGSYSHWCARTADLLGPDWAFWNLGIGFGRAADAASGGGWLYKAAQADLVCVCFGVNDLFQFGDEERLRNDLASIVRRLKRAGCRVLLQTIPPFNYTGDHLGRWLRTNDYLRRELSREADLFFDPVPVLQADDAHPQNAKYGGHPDAAGCAAWASALAPVLKEGLDRFFG